MTGRLARLRAKATRGTSKATRDTSKANRGTSKNTRGTSKNSRSTSKNTRGPSKATRGTKVKRKQVKAKARKKKRWLTRKPKKDAKGNDTTQASAREDFWNHLNTSELSATSSTRPFSSQLPDSLLPSFNHHCLTITSPLPRHYLAITSPSLFIMNTKPARQPAKSCACIFYSFKPTTLAWTASRGTRHRDDPGDPGLCRRHRT